MLRPVLHCPHGPGTDRIRPGQTRPGPPRSCGHETVGAGRPGLAEASYAGHSAAITPQSVAMAMTARGLRETARVLPGSPPTVLTARQKQRRQGHRGLLTGWRPCRPSRSRWHAGTPWLTPPGRGWRRGSDAAKTPSAASSHRSWSPVAARRVPRTAGAPTHGISLPRSPPWARSRRSKSRARPSSSGLG
jgi:hypothetical protein